MNKLLYVNIWSWGLKNIFESFPKQKLHTNIYNIGLATINGSVNKKD